MLNVADCLVQTHDLKLVGLAAAVCVGASAMSFSLLPRLWSDQERSSKFIWLILTALVAAAGVWATHFIAMLAFQPVMPTAFGPDATALSLLIAVIVTTLALVILTSSQNTVQRLGAGALLGCATVAMHYTGISGLRAPAELVWNPSLVALSAVFSIVFATAAISVAWRRPGRAARYGGAALFTLSIVSLHFTGMSAITLVPDPTRPAPSGLSGDLLAYCIGAVTLLIVGCAMAAWLIDRRGRYANEQRLKFLARHDLLTSLPNRLLLEEVVRRETLSTRGAERAAALLCLDLDGFKEVNDIFGHTAGDRLLIEVARRLQELLGERCVAARLGGDEFAVFATGLGRLRTPDGAAQSVIDSLSAPFDVDGAQIHIGCSVGVARYPDDGSSYALLLSRADIALGRAKADGKGVFRFFEPAMDEAVRERRRLAQDLRSAIGTSQLRVEYQPQVALSENEVIGFEALMRWDHPTLGTVSPVTFIPIAEETGLILRLGEWVLRESCREAARWDEPLGIAVNLSIAQFRQDGLAELVRSILDETGLAPSRLELEVTESLFLDNSARSLHTLARIKDMGVRIAMDDFGTGYSSLSTLQSFPFDKLKIDRSFTSQVGQTAKGTAIVKAIVALGESLGMRVVAEGVETGEQLAFLRDHHCSEVQGYLCGRPKPIAAYGDLLLRRSEGATVVQLRYA